MLGRWEKSKIFPENGKYISGSVELNGWPVGDTVWIKETVPALLVSISLVKECLSYNSTQCYVYIYKCVYIHNIISCN